MIACMVAPSRIREMTLKRLRDFLVSLFHVQVEQRIRSTRIMAQTTQICTRMRFWGLTDMPINLGFRNPLYLTTAGKFTAKSETMNNF